MTRRLTAAQKQLRRADSQPISQPKFTPTIHPICQAEFRVFQKEL
jgi:hypothetical protein